MYPMSGRLVGRLMRLKNYGPGEALDRLSILSLKLLFGAEAGKDTAHFRAEQVVLLTELRAQNHLAAYLEDALSLAAVNAALWHAEDDLRELRRRGELPIANVAEAAGAAADRTATVNLAFRIQALNDQRAALVASINKATGNHLGEEKSHVSPDSKE